MKNILIATAGHIDHGKTALITALNGFKGDNTDEEKRRGITIDLSFSNLRNSEKNIAFIDVPGHENLLKTMISGAFGASAALLVIAANEGLMPQSREHMKVLELLGVKNIILCITKCDLATNEQILGVKEQAKNELKSANILATFELSIKNQASIESLKEFLFSLEPLKLQKFPVPRYHIDRLFSLKGVGLVATGTLSGASISVGEKLFDYDANAVVSVRSLQVHDKSVDIANPSERVAINITSDGDIKKGDFISKKGFFRSFSEIDCVFYGEISHNGFYTLCLGTKSISAKALVLSTKTEQNSHFITLKLEKPVFACFDEHYILLNGSRLAGGGVVLNPVSEPMKKGAKITLLNLLLAKDFKGAFELLKNTHETGFGLLCAPQRFAMSQQDALSLAKSLNNAICDDEALNVYDKSALKLIKDFIKFIIAKNELAMFSPASVALRLSWASPYLASLAIAELSDILECQNGLYFKKGADFSKLKERLEDGILKELERGGLAPLAPYNIYELFECDRKAGDDAMKRLCARGLVLRLAHNLFVSKTSLQTALSKLKELISRDGYADVSNAKEYLNLSRKYVISYLEALDQQSDIIKIENKRVFKK